MILVFKVLQPFQILFFNYLLISIVKVVQFFSKHVIVSSQLFEIIYTRGLFLIRVTKQ